MARHCPDCKTLLEAEDILGIQLDVCPKCAGIWFDDGELLKLKELGDAEMAEVDDAFVPADGETTRGDPKRLCPDCDLALQEFAYLYTSNVKLDSCEGCHGTWVEHGELRAMQAALATARDHAVNPAVAHQVLAIQDESAHADFLTRHRTIARALKVISLRRSAPF